MALPTEEAPVVVLQRHVRRRARVRQAADLVLRDAVRVARPVHHPRRRDGAADGLQRQPELRAVGRRVPSALHRRRRCRSPLRPGCSSRSSTRASPGYAPRRTSRSPQTRSSSAAHAEAFFGFDAFSVEGHFSFDALLRFSPFYLIVEVSSGFVGQGVRRGRLGGPPARLARGADALARPRLGRDRASSSSRSTSTSTSRSASAGTTSCRRSRCCPGSGPSSRSWRAGARRCPASGRLFVSLRDLGAADALVLHPVGTLQISQRFAPLNLPLDRIGKQKPSDVNVLTVTCGERVARRARPGSREVCRRPVLGYGRRRKALGPGLRAARGGDRARRCGQAWTTGPLAQRKVRYEQIIVDTPPERPRNPLLRVLARPVRALPRPAPRSSVSGVAGDGAAPEAVRREGQRDRGCDTPSLPRRTTGRPRPTATFGSYAEAEAHLATVVRADPNLAGVLHVIPGAEVNVDA